MDEVKVESEVQIGHFRVTAKQLAERLHCEYADAAGLIRILEIKNLAKKAGMLAPPSGKGKSSTIYELPEVVTFTLVAAGVEVQ